MHLAARVSFLLVAVLVVAGCSLLPIPQPSAPVDPDPAAAEPLEKALDAWRAAGIDSYTWTITFACECNAGEPTEVTVVDGVATRARTPSGPIELNELSGLPLTVDALLQRTIDVTKAGGSTGAAWAGTNGVPTQVSMDPNRDVLDDELTVRVKSFDPAP